MERRWLDVKKGGTIFGHKVPAPCDFWIFQVDDKVLGSFCADPEGGWLVLLNPEFYGKAEQPGGGFCKSHRLRDGLTVVEAKDAVEKLLCGHL